jgi:hypothetical protein
MNGWLYAAACIVAPTLWGMLMVWALGWAERTWLGRRPTATGVPESGEERHLPSPEYHI